MRLPHESRRVFAKTEVATENRWAARQAIQRLKCNAENCIGRRESDWRKLGLQEVDQRGDLLWAHENSRWPAIR